MNDDDHHKIGTVVFCNRVYSITRLVELNPINYTYRCNQCGMRVKKDGKRIVTINPDTG